MKIKQLAVGFVAAAVVLCTTVLPLPGAFAPNAASLDLTDGLVLHSTFDESDVSNNTVADASGNNNTGSIVGPLTFVEGVRGNAVKFEGQNVAGNDNSNGDRYVDYGRKIDFATGNFTLSLWFKSTGASSNATILSNKNFKSGSNTGFAMGCFADELRFNLTAKGKPRTDIQTKGALVTAKNGDWHHLAVTVNRSGSMVYYVDGVSAGSTSISSTSGVTIDDGFPLVLGAGGNYKNAVNNCLLDELRVYNKAVSADFITGLYAVEGASLCMDEMLATINTLSPGTLYTAEAIAAITKTVQDAKAALSSTAEGDIPALLAQVQNAYDDFMGGTKPSASFHLVSDVHIQGNDASEKNSVNYVAGLKDMKTVNPDTTIAFVNVGDFTSSSSSAQYEGFYGLTAANNPVSDEQTLVLLGNHDVRGPAGTDSVNWNRDPRKPEACVYWETAKALYLRHNANYLPANDKQTLYHAKELGGYTFIMLNTELGLKDAMYMSDEQIAWFEETMKACYQADPTKPVFIFAHQALNDTHWRSNVLDGFDGITTSGIGQEYQSGGDAKVKAIMEKYPVGIFFNGHIHNGFGVVEAIARPYGTLVEVPSFNESENGEKTPGIGYEVQIYDDMVLLRARNYVTGKWLPEYNIALPNVSLGAQVKAANELLAAGSYTPDSKAAVTAAVAAANRLLNKTYDQSALAWNTVTPPDPYFYHADTWVQISTASQTLADAVQALESVETTVVKSPTQDLFLQAGKHINLPTSQYSSPNYDAKVLKIKISDDHRNQEVGDFTDDNQNYSRKTLIEFPLEGITTAHNKAEIVLHLTAAPGRHFNTASAWTLEDTAWDAAIVTWNSAPARAEKAGSFNAGSIDPDTMELRIDVSEAVSKAVAAGKTSITFDLLNDTEANDNLLSIHSSRAADETKRPTMVATVVEVPVDPTQKEEDPKFTALRESWTAYLLGGTGEDLDMSVDAVQAYVQTLDKNASKYWNDMVKSSNSTRTNLWSDLELTPIKDYSTAAYTRSGNVGVSFNRLRDIAYAWATKGCTLYQNEEVLTELIAALDHMTGTYFKYGEKGWGNWYHWEITSPTALMNTCMVLYDELTADQLARYTKATKWYVPYCNKGGPNSNGPAMTGGNLLLKANGVAQCGILSQDGAMLDNVKSGVKTVLVYNEPAKFYTKDADGFYADGSYIQHQALAYIGGYGADLYSNLGVFLNNLGGSEWEIAYDDNAENVAYDFVFNGIEPFIYEGHTMDMVSSRDVTRPSHNDHERTGRILEAILPLRGAFPTAEQNARFDSMVKYLLGQDTTYYFSCMDSITAIMQGVQLMGDTTIAPRGDYSLTKVFTMDKAVHLNKNFGFALSMHSDRTYGHELINNEGKRTWNTSDGMYYLYDADVNKYAEGYWASIDPTRLPGITAEHLVFNNGMGDRTKNIYNWAGGTTIGGNGVAGMHLRTLGTANSHTRNGTDAKKSWFMFGDRIIAIGSGITSSTGNTVETIVDNAKLKDDGSNVITVDGQPANWNADPTTLQANWLHIEGNVQGSQTGYYIPEGQTLTAIKETRTGNWANQGASSGTATNTYATFWFDHGTRPSNASYEYVLLPGKTAEQTAAWAAAPDVEVLENSSAIHAARDNAQNIVAVNFWQAGTSAAAGFGVNAPASVMAQRSGNTMEVSISDPTQKDAVIELTLAVAGEVTAKADNVTVLQTVPYIKLSVDTTKLGGQPSAATIQVDESVGTEVVSLAQSFEPIKVELGTAFSALNLPATVSVLATDMNTYDVAVEWNRSDYHRLTAGVYNITGTLVMPDGLANSSDITAAITVEVGETKLFAECDTLVRAGSYANAVQNASSKGLGLKLDTDISYVRNGLLRLSIEALPEAAERVWLNLTTSTDFTKAFTGADIYRVSNAWDQNTVTYNSRPARFGDAPVASFTAADAAKGHFQMDITEVVKQARANNETAVSFEIVITGTPDSKNQITVSAIESDNELDRPYLSWEQTPVSEVVDKENLQALAGMAAGLDTSIFNNYDADAIAAALANANTVLADEDADMAQVQDAEDLLTDALLSLRRIPQPII